MSDLENDFRRYRHPRRLTHVYGHDENGNEGKMPIDQYLAVSDTPSLAPTALTMDLVYRHRFNELHAPYMDYFRPTLAFLDDYSQFFQTIAGGARILDGFLSFDLVNGNGNVIREQRPKSVRIYSAASFTPVWTGAATEQIRRGIYVDAANFVTVIFDRGAGSVNARVVMAGADAATFTPVNSIDYTKYVSLGVTIFENIVTAWGYQTNGWTPLGTWNVGTGINLRSADLSSYRWGWEVRNNGGATPTKVKDIRISPSGPMGIRDVNLVSYENGEPYRGPRGELYFTAGLPAATPNGGNVGAPAQLAVFELDVSTYQMRMTASFEFSEVVSGTKGVYGGASAKLVMDRMSRVWRLLFSSYNSPSIPAGQSRVRYATLNHYPLRGYQVIDKTDLMPNSWNDMDLIWDGLQWILVCNIAAVTPSIRKAKTWDGLLTASVAPLGITDGEGNRLRRIGGVIYWMTQKYTTPTPAPAWRVWRASDLAYIGNVQLNDVSNLMEPAHPNLVPIAVNGGTRYIAPTFDGAQMRIGNNASYFAASNGNLLIYESQLVTGREYADHY